MAPRSVRFRPETHQLEFLSGWSQYGQAFDEWGRHFTITNDSNGRHEVIAARYLQRNPALLLPSVQQDISTADNNKVFPITRNPRFEILTDVGTLTSSCSITLPYLGGPRILSFDRVACLAESAHNVVHCDVWSDAGVTYSARRLEEKAEFVASTDAWFRPLICTSVRTALSISSIITETPSSIQSGWLRTPITPDIFTADRIEVESTELFRIHKRLCPYLRTLDSAKRPTRNLSSSCPARTSGGAGPLSACW